MVPPWANMIGFCFARRGILHRRPSSRCQIFWGPVLFWALLVGATNVSASPWGQERGKLMLLTTTERFEQRASIDPAIATTHRIDSSAYGEYGLRTNITIGAKATYSIAEQASITSVERASGISEFLGFAQYRFLRTPKSAASVYVGAGKQTNANTGIDFQTNRVDTELRVQYGRDWIAKPIKIFTITDIGFVKRFGANADQLRPNIGVGIGFGKDFLLLNETLNTISLRNHRGAGQDFDTIKLKSTLVWRPDHKWSLQAGLIEEVATRNTRPGRTFLLSIWSRF